MTADTPPHTAVEALRLALPILEDDLASFEHDTPPALFEKRGFVCLDDLHCDIHRYRECEQIMAALAAVRQALQLHGGGESRSDFASGSGDMPAGERDYTAQSLADLRTAIERSITLSSPDFPNYADWPIALPAGHWRAILALLNPTSPWRDGWSADGSTVTLPAWRAADILAYCDARREHREVGLVPIGSINWLRPPGGESGT